MNQLNIALLIFAGTYVWLVTERAPSYIVVLCGSGAILLARILTLREAVRCVNWQTLLLLLGMFALVEGLTEYGIFEWWARRLLDSPRVQPKRFFFILPLIAGVLSMAVNNITVMVFMTPLSLRICRKTGLDPFKVILAEVCAANMIGAATLTGSPPNLAMATMLGYGFGRVFVHMAPIVLLSAATFYAAYTPTHQKMPVGSFLDSEREPDIFELIPTRGMKRLQFFTRIDFETLLFFLGLFILVGALEKVGLFQILAHRFLVIREPFVLAMAMLWGAALVSAFVDNIPMAMAMAYLIKEMAVRSPGILSSFFVWAALAGLTLGGNMTPIGASPNVVACGMMHKLGIRTGWKQWITLAVPPTLAALLAASALLWIQYRISWY